MLTRRNFITSSAATVALASASKSVLAANSHYLKPARLRPGEGVGIISPASAAFVSEDVNVVVDAVRALGLVPYLAPHLRDRYGYLAGKDTDRASDINRFFADPKSAALLPIRGGWGCSRILPYLDYQLIRNNPKIIIGFSDITALILGIHAQTGIITFHGPNGLTSWRTAPTDYFRRVLFAGEMVTFQNQKDSDDANRLMQVKNRIRTINPGKARGRLIGGNLSVLSGIVGSPYVPNLKGAILFLEDTNENVYRIDRLITHLKLAGVFNQLSGFIFGQCTQCLPDADYGSLTLEEVLNDHIRPLKIPSWSGAEIGHLDTILTLPIGTEVEIDASLGKIRMLEPAVI
ncbi:S66 peptidase family protein [Aetokthonos hydrillicola]|uniref:S66 peptidase family protein n=1 Tax=Aetokthonos hydrillicola TaxID=1550245 RepID=UPI001ABAF7FC|nr:LD-carboxypeptidase [Aetokthonos hydrillicola]MBO3463535.1 LD-carboxypeptidase [Aetokthonos hydrillicola CCALA 1050]